MDEVCGDGNIFEENPWRVDSISLEITNNTLSPTNTCKQAIQLDKQVCWTFSEYN
jgi:hypothetical protein